MIRSAIVLLVAATVTSTSFIKVCDWVFRCGCDWLWAAADAHCNIHVAGGKHCPFCSFGYFGYAGIFGTIVAVQAVFAFLPNWSAKSRLAAAVASYPVTFGILALVLGKYTGYWD